MVEKSPLTSASLLPRKRQSFSRLLIVSPQPLTRVNKPKIVHIQTTVVRKEFSFNRWWWKLSVVGTLMR